MLKPMSAKSYIGVLCSVMSWAESIVPVTEPILSRQEPTQDRNRE